MLVLGSPGAGKSTLAREIAHRTGLPLVHLDRHYWRAGWVEPDKAQWAREVERLAGGERWVMDGNYGGTLPLRLARADTVVWLDYPTWLCLGRILRRAVQYRGHVRPDMADGCGERVSWEFLVHIARFRRSSRRRIVDGLAAFPGAVTHLHDDAEARAYLAGLA